MEIHQLRYFCAVADSGSFTLAAEQEGITQPSLSQQIRKLEHAVGSSLFVRLGRQTRLTPAGEALYSHAIEILRHSRDATLRIRQLSETVCGPLRVGVIPTVLPYLLAPRLGRFIAQHPELDFELVEDTTTQLVKRLQNGELDVALAVLPLRSPEVVCSELVRDPLMLAVSKQHPWASAGSADLHAAQQERLLLLREGHCFRGDVLTACTRAKAEFHAVFESDSLSTIFSLVASGMGISIVPAMSARHADGCVLLPLLDPKVRRVGFAKLRASVELKPVRAFTDWLRKDIAMQQL